MTNNYNPNVAPKLEYSEGLGNSVQMTDWISVGLAFFVGVALQNWSPWIHEGLTFRSTLLIAAIAAFTLSRFSVDGHKGWMVGLLITSAAVSATTAVMFL